MRIIGLLSLLMSRTSTDLTLCCAVSQARLLRSLRPSGFVLSGRHVTGVEGDAGGALTVMVESPPGLLGCATCRVVARGHGQLIDTPSAGAPAGGDLVEHRRNALNRYARSARYRVKRASGRSVVCNITFRFYER